MKLVYVFDCRVASPTVYVVRVPVLLARLLCRIKPYWDYAPTPRGF